VETMEVVVETEEVVTEAVATAAVATAAVERAVETVAHLVVVE